MKFRGLPLDIRPGPVELVTAFNDCPLLQPCIYCKFYNRVYFICEMSHITCVECFLPDTAHNKLTRPQYESFCKPCRRKVTLYRIEIPLPLLKNLTFICGCDFTGRLCEIKKHVKSDDYCMSCSLLAQDQAPTSDEFDVALAKQTLELQEMCNDHQAQILVIKEKFHESFGSKIDSAGPDMMLYSKRIADASILNIGFLNRRLKVLKAETMVLMKRSVKITPRVQDLFGRVLVDAQRNTLERELPEAPNGEGQPQENN